MMATIDNKTLCISLMKADSEDEVIKILKEHGYWDRSDCWRLYGDIENNYSAAGNQADEAEAALVEKLTNSRDAILLNECLERGFDPEGDKAPKSVREAVAMFFEDNPDTEIAGQVKEWSDKKRREIARKISLYVTGNKPKPDSYPCINIADVGEGQTPSRIPETILSLGKSIKLRIPFTHGKFNMGGTAALAYCGRNNIQFVLSKRNQKLVKDNAKETDRQWGFTVVRRVNPEGNVTSSVYKFLAPENLSSNGKGDLLSFDSESMPILAKYNVPYSVETTWGTLIKLYDFKTKHKQSVQGSGGLLRPLDLLAPDMGLPLRLHECRYETGDPGSYEHQLNGLRVRLHDMGKSVLEPSYPTSHPMIVNGNTFLVTVYAFKDDKAKTYRDSDKGIIFTLNGQSQGWLEDRFFSRNNVGLGYLKNSLLVIVDCNELDYRAQEELFMNSRDRLRKNPFRDRVEDELENVLSVHPGLESLQEERKRKMKSEKLDDSKPLETVLASIFKHSALSRIFLKGERLANPFKPEKVKPEPIKFEGQMYPTYFKFKKLKVGEVLNRDAHIGSSCRVLFETDAENEFFTRKTDRGTHRLFLKDGETMIDAGQKGFNYSINLYNGIATLSLTLGNLLQVGHSAHFMLEVNHAIRIVDGPFSNAFNLSIKPPVTPSPTPPTPRPDPPGSQHGNGREKPAGIKFPEHYPIYEAEWNSHGFDRNSAVQVIKSKVSQGASADEANAQVEFTFYINMDNVYLQYEIKDDINNKAVLEAYYKYGLILIGMSLIYDDTQFKDPKSQLEGIEDRISDLCRAVSPVLIPMIKEFGDLDLKDELIKELSR